MRVHNRDADILELLLAERRELVAAPLAVALPLDKLPTRAQPGQKSRDDPQGGITPVARQR